jgi:hypothetical protein
MTILDQVASALAALTPVFALMAGMGIFTKYVPFMAKVPNMVIPFLNALIAFLAVFQGPAPAEAGIFGNFVHELSLQAKIAGSLALAGVQKIFWDAFVREVLHKVGLQKAEPKPAALA